MRLLVIGKTDGHESQRLAQEGEAIGHSVTVASIEEISFDVHDYGRSVRLDAENIFSSFDVIYIRSFFPYISETLLLAESAGKAGIRVIDRQFTDGRYIQSKMYDYWRLQEASIPVPPTVQAMNLDDARKALADMDFPVVAKGVHGSRGKYVFKLDDPTTLARHMTPNMVGSFTFQPYFAFDEEYRVLVLGGNVVGTIRKYAPEGDFRKNFAVGGTAEPADINDDLKKLCEKAAIVLGYEFAGVDIAIIDGKPMILEVNRSPGFRLFEDITGINVAKAFIDYAAASATS